MSNTENTNSLPRSDVFNYTFYMASEMLFLVMPTTFMNIFFTDNLLISAVFVATVLPSVPQDTPGKTRNAPQRQLLLPERRPHLNTLEAFTLLNPHSGLRSS
jgi:hypothetical protein